MKGFYADCPCKVCAEGCGRGLRTRGLRAMRAVVGEQQMHQSTLACVPLSTKQSAVRAMWHVP